MVVDESKSSRFVMRTPIQSVGPESVVIADKSAHVDLTDSLTGVI